MNKAMYGILAAALLAASKSTRGGVNTSADIKGGLKTLLKNQRKDVALATIYSFINFEETGAELTELSKISNVEVAVQFPHQPILALAFSKDEQETEEFIKTIYDAIVSSFGSEEQAQKAWKKSYLPLVEAYNKFFTKHDFGIAYSYITSSIYPTNINNEDWFKLFQKSDVGALELVNTQTLKGKSPQIVTKSHEEFLSAWLKSKIAEDSITPGDVFDSSPQMELLEIKNIYSTAGDIFYYLATSQRIGNLEIKAYPVQFIHQLLENHRSHDCVEPQSERMLISTVEPAEGP